MAELSRRFTTSAGIALAWDRWGPGDGIPVLLLHGYAGSSYDFGPELARLAEQLPVVAVDLPGHGLSGHHPRKEPYSVAALSTAVGELCTGALGGIVHAVGHSMGGSIALRLALSQPTYVRSLVVMSTSVGSFASEDPVVREFVVSVFETMDPDDPEPISFESADGALIAAVTEPQWRARRREVSELCDPRARRDLGLEIYGGRLESVGHLLGSIRCAVTVLVGDGDEPFLGASRDLCGALADARLVEIAGAGHSPQLTHPAIWRQVVLEHVDRV